LLSLFPIKVSVDELDELDEPLEEPLEEPLSKEPEPPLTELPPGNVSFEPSVENTT
jgi:hypothetical protein